MNTRNSIELLEGVSLRVSACMCMCKVVYVCMCLCVCVCVCMCASVCVYKKCPNIIVNNFFENGLPKNFDNKNFIEISLKLNFSDIFENFAYFLLFSSFLKK